MRSGSQAPDHAEEDEDVAADSLLGPGDDFAEEDNDETDVAIATQTQTKPSGSSLRKRAQSVDWFAPNKRKAPPKLDTQTSHKNSFLLPSRKLLR